MTREQIIERERRWARPAALSAFAGAAFLIGGVAARFAVPNESHAADQLRAFSTHHVALILSSALEAVGLVLISAPLLYLFLAAAARNPRVRFALVGLCVLGPLLFAVQAVVLSVGLKSAGDEFVKGPDEARQSLAFLSSRVASKPDSINQVTVYNDANQAEVESTDGSFYGVKFPASAEQKLLASLDKAGVDTNQDSSGTAGDAYASYLAVNSSTYKLASGLALPAGLAMIFAIVYPALQAFRVGLISRMFSTLGAIAAASLIILPLAPLLIGLWVSWLGLVYLNRTPRGRPPAWDAGTAVPWPRPGQPVPDAAGPIQGSAREVDPAERPAANAPRQRGERRKRKSRD